jgi:hypothetical protein
VFKFFHNFSVLNTLVILAISLIQIVRVIYI